MRAAVVSEWRKITSTSMWWLLALAMAGYMAFTAGAVAFSLTVEPAAGQGTSMPIDPRTLAISVYTVAPSLGYVFPLVLGALAVTGELRHRTLTTTLWAEPRRTVVLGAKLVVNAGVGALYGVVGVAAAVAAGAGTLALMGEVTYLASADAWIAIGWSVVALALWGVIGVGVGTLVTNQIAAVVSILAFTQFLEPIARLGLAAFDATVGVSKFLPGAAAEALVGASIYSSAGIVDLLDRWQGGLVLLAYALVLGLIGRFTTFARDVT